MHLPKYTLPLSIIGTIAGGTVLLKDYMGGPRYKGEERIAGKTVIITGANTGIGKETARELARRGGRIIMACRDIEKCEKVRQEFILETANHNIECRKLDLASIGSIRAFCKGIHASERHLDILINNAGVMMCPKMLTEDGFEMQLGVNHLGHFLLTYLLLDKLKASAPSRIIIVSSLAHKRGSINFDDLNSANSYDKHEAYKQSKLANLLHQKELVSRLEGTGVTVNSLHPGIVATELGRHLPITKSSFSSFLLFPIKFILMKTPIQGAQTTLRLALDPALETVTGKYFSDCKELPPASQALDDVAAKRLWAVSEAWTRANVP
ncbi:retinol dehydrogenase 13-like [Physella acuta]|uniref:retinol dehydrogenase 13-like n=1 Tax=Physella acuta TaxID=109671 RepID=UPI0027DC63FA|nr:retinol dehydrogenase 13-like [Physella acuta]XP_059154987.1 retinol dehydrogenase 13-like [Physella acuta]XP_059154988.1 retinol dehydrogenase 13-like [Physella acuta]